MKIGALSDAHGNGPALGKALQVLSDAGAEEFFFLGDSIGYIPSVSALELLTSSAFKIFALKGNHEHMILHGSPDSERDRVYRHREVFSDIQPFLEHLAGWPESLTVERGMVKILMVHGSPGDPLFGYVYPDTVLSPDDSVFDFVLMGNTHRPFQRRVGGTTYVNVGSCGFPRDDGRFGSAVLLDTDLGCAEILRFNIEAETEDVLLRSPQVHPSVLETLKRRSTNMEGKVVT